MPTKTINGSPPSSHETVMLPESPATPPVARRAPHNLAPTEIAVPYRPLEMIGQGGMGEVWRAVQGGLNRIVAIKRMRDPEIGAETDLSRQFYHEAIITAQLDHPNIIPAYDLSRDDEGRPLLAMKHVTGRLWSDAIAADIELMDSSEYLSKHLAILMDVTQATAFAHSRGIVHRDLKPQQTLVGDFGEVYLTDWGLGVLFDHELLVKARGGLEPPELPTITTARNPAGTPSYMAPEQSDLTAARIGPWTDVYLLGATLYHVLTGRPPRTGDGFNDMAAQIRSGYYIPIEKRTTRPLAENMASLVRRAMCPNPTARPSAAEFLSRLKSEWGIAIAAQRRPRWEALNIRDFSRFDRYFLSQEDDTPADCDAAPSNGHSRG